MELINLANILSGPYNITVDVTNKCNLKCLHCYNHSGDIQKCNSELSDEELMKLMYDICLIMPRNICFCGGEPLLRKNILIDMIKDSVKAKINTSLVSNGLLLDKNTAMDLKNSGLKNIQISLDGIGKSHDRLRGMNGAFMKAKEGIENSISQQIHTEVSFSPTTWNIEEIEQVANLCENMGVNTLNVQATMPIGRGYSNIDIIPQNEDYLKLLKKLRIIKRKLIVSNSSMRIDWGADPIENFIYYSNELSYYTNISIKTDGSVMPCMYLPVPVGNIREHSLKYYYQNNAFDKAQMTVLKEKAESIRCISEMRDVLN